MRRYSHGGLESFSLTPTVFFGMLSSMSSLIDEVTDLVLSKNVKISDHGYDELSNDAISTRDVVWGIPRGQTEPAVLVTAYRPDTTIWEDDFLRRKK